MHGSPPGQICVEKTLKILLLLLLLELGLLLVFFYYRNYTFLWYKIPGHFIHSLSHE